MQASHLQCGKTAWWAGLLGLLLAMLSGMVPGMAPSVATAATTVSQKPQASQNRARPVHAVPVVGPSRAKPLRGTASARQAVAPRQVAVAPGKRGMQTAKGAKARVARSGGLQCVPFARNASGIIVSGNAHLWWGNAAGVYARGQAPEAGSVLSFRANRSMPLGHVAVVRHVINARELEIDHANWAGPGGRKGMVSRGVSVVDVSDANDWTAVRVALGRGGDYGSIYPANGFIYERPDTGGTMLAANPLAAPPVPELNAPARDLRPLQAPAQLRNSGYASVTYMGGNYEEVAEAPPAAPRRAVRRKPVRAQH